mgnify:CR=1 FL=1
MGKPYLQILPLLACLVLAGPVGAEDEAEEHGFPYDAVDVPIETVIEQATAANKPIFIEFSTEG